MRTGVIEDARRMQLAAEQLQTDNGVDNYHKQNQQSDME